MRGFLRRLAGAIKGEPRDRPPAIKKISPSHVHIVLVDSGWILERLGREIETRLDYVTVGFEPFRGADISYYINYHSYPNERISPIEMALFTHVEEWNPVMKERFFQVARNMDVCVCMSQRYADVLEESGIKDIKVITPGVDLEIYRPVIRIGVVGRTYESGRKGEDLVARVMDEPGFEWHFTGQGWPGPCTWFDSRDLPGFYNSVDYILVPSHHEGGPMSLLEALACGKEVIAPRVGFVPEYPHIEYETGDPDDLLRVLRELRSKRERLREAVLHRTWDEWARKHGELFREMLTQ